jgi:hypothetical protein
MDEQWVADVAEKTAKATQEFMIPFATGLDKIKRGQSGNEVCMLTAQECKAIIMGFQLLRGDGREQHKSS